jgi:hypothetical protein
MPKSPSNSEIQNVAVSVYDLIPSTEEQLGLFSSATSPDPAAKNPGETPKFQLRV